MAITTADIAAADIDNSSKMLLSDLLAQIDALKARPVVKHPVSYVIHWSDGAIDTYDLTPVTPAVP